eukprot:544227-Amphidinium_carterae.1
MARCHLQSSLVLRLWGTALSSRNCSRSSSYFGCQLPDYAEWRQSTKLALKQCQRVGDVTGVLAQQIDKLSGGLGEFVRFHNTPTPSKGPRAPRTPVTASNWVNRDELLPLPLPQLVHIDRQWARSHSRQAKLKRVAVAQSRWEILGTLGVDYLFAGMQVLLTEALHPSGAPHLVEARSSASSLIRCAAARLTKGDVELDMQRIQKALRGSRVTYGGDVVEHAHSVTTAQILPTLPSADAGARVPILDHVDLKLVPWLAQPDLALKPQSEWPATVPRAKVMCADADWPEVCRLFHERGLIAPISDSGIFHAHDKPVLNGLFGVEKVDKAPRGPALRLIMNLVPTNTYLKEVLGEVSTLPRAGQWAMIVVHEDELMTVYGEDQTSSFYLYALPEAWRPYMAFGRRVDGSVFGRPELGMTYVSSTVCPMGWMLVVAGMQHVGRKLALCHPPGGAGLDLPELRGDRPFPLTLPTAQTLIREAWSRANVVRNERKSVVEELSAVNKGALFDGELGCIGPSPQRLGELVYILLHLISSENVHKHSLQIALGLAAYFGTFRRPLFSVLAHAYRYAASDCHGPLPRVVVDELLTFATCLIFGFIDVRAKVDPQVVCTDASESGGGACVSSELAPSARAHWQQQLQALAQPPALISETTTSAQSSQMPSLL